jgi:hypothetical protein
MLLPVIIKFDFFGLLHSRFMKEFNHGEQYRSNIIILAAQQQLQIHANIRQYNINL